MNDSLSFWENYYSNHQDPTDESLFARFVIPFLKEGNSLYELGCGNGRDSVFFANNKLQVNAFDQCATETKYLNEKFSDLESVHFNQGDFTNLGDKNPVNYIYSRFSLHSVAEEKEIETINWAYKTLKNKGLFFIEVRSIFDELCGQGEDLGNNAFVTDHYRRFIEIGRMEQHLKNAGFEILYKIQSKGLAPYKDEDPVVIRFIGQKV